MDFTQFSVRIDDCVVCELDVEAARNRMSRVGMLEAILRERYHLPAEQEMKRQKSSARKKKNTVASMGASNGKAA